MKCIRPIYAGFNFQGEIVFRDRERDKGVEPFQFDCRKCLPCRLNIAREKAIRAVHEAKTHKGNIFLTLTYNDESLVSEKLIYEDFQNFMKSLREKTTRGITDKELKDELHISYMVTGEYGEKTKRPHWHAILFNYYPKDAKYHYTTDHGEKVFTSEEIDAIWKKGNTEFGSVTMDSAGYVARYAAKKLVHGKDEEHDYHPIHKTSSKRAIGRSWIEKYHKHVFDHGYIVLPNGEKAGIPRYYTDWYKKNYPDKYESYIKTKREETIARAQESQRREELEYLSQLFNRRFGAPQIQTRQNVKLRCLEKKFEKLQERLKI